MCYSAGLEEDDYKWLYEKKEDKRDYAQIILDRLKKERRMRQRFNLMKKMLKACKEAKR